MIKNSKQRKVAEQQLKELEENVRIYELENADLDKTSAKYRLGLSSFNNLINSYKKDIQEYDDLQADGMKVIRATNISDLPSVLIKTRLGKKMTQKDIADNIGIDEQQIQRYEANDFESAKWTRMLEIIEALDINIELQKIVVGKINVAEPKFDLPKKFTDEKIKAAAIAVRKNHSLLVL